MNTNSSVSAGVEKSDAELAAIDQYPVYPVYSQSFDVLSWATYIDNLRLAFQKGAEWKESQSLYKPGDVVGYTPHTDETISIPKEESPVCGQTCGCTSAEECHFQPVALSQLNEILGSHKIFYIDDVSELVKQYLNKQITIAKLTECLNEISQPKEISLPIEGKETIGEIISKAILSHELNPDVVERVIGLPKGVMNEIMNDEIYTNSIPIILFKNLVVSLHIPFNKIEQAMMPTFELLLSRETPDSIKKKPHGYALWENKESVCKYTNRLKELFLPTDNSKLDNEDIGLPVKEEEK